MRKKKAGSSKGSRAARGADAASLREARAAWEKAYAEASAESPERLPRFSTISDDPIAALYTPLDTEGIDAFEDIGFPGEFPYTRGVHPTLYRGKLWTMRQFSGFGTAEDTNRRFHYLLAQGQTGLSVAFHFPTLMGRDSDDARSEGEVGKCGVAVESLDDMEILFRGIPLGEVTTSMTTNAPAAILLAMYIAVGEKQGVAMERLGGTIQNDILKEYIAQKSWIFPPRPSMRIITDILAFATDRLPRWNTISISGYHIREAGSTAVQELAFTIADGIGYVRAGVEAGLDVDAFAPRLSFFFNAHLDFFEEIAKYRAARRMWARIARDRFGAKDPRSWRMRFHTQTAGCTLTAQQPMNNVVRVAWQALAAILGGTQSLHTNSMDETIGLPTEEAVTVALRTQQLLAEESGVASTIDPLGGSYFVEALTNRMEQEANGIIAKIDEMGGILAAIELGYPQREIQEAAVRYQKQVESGEKTVIGVNRFVVEDERTKIPLLRIEDEVAERQIERTRKLRARRDAAAWGASLERLWRAAQGKDNLMPFILDAVKSSATLGEICDTLRAVFGEYRDPAMF